LNAAADIAASVDALPPLRDVIRAHELRAEKKLGQNFLLDLNLTGKIARAAGDMTGASVFEIGPGPGGLTRALLKAGAPHLTAIEFDPRAVAALEELKQAAAGRLKILLQDALRTDVMTLAGGKPVVIVANLPYNIATPLLIGWLEQIYAQPTAFRSMTLMFQKEVGDRICAASGGKVYGRLGVMAQWLCNVKSVFDIPPSAFTPPPKVVSSVVHFVPRAVAPSRPAFAMVEKITAAAFGQRRKMIRSSLKDYLPAIEAEGINPELRAENLSVEEFIKLAIRAEEMGL
jgi:16S rRNA (adenine1518-N6/adenine1519-N6)-dimethyltransferase